MNAAEHLYNYQMNQISDFILLGKEPELPEFHEYLVDPLKFLDIHTLFKWINKGETIAGSHLASLINPNIKSSDVDIYFHTEEDALHFANINELYVLPATNQKNDVCYYTSKNNYKLNLIYGIKFNTPEELIAGFDIRACAIAYLPNSGRFFGVESASLDAAAMSITFQVGARNITVKRLIKYIYLKGFKIDKYQRAIFVELLKMGRHNSHQELFGGY